MGIFYIYLLNDLYKKISIVFFVLLLYHLDTIRILGRRK